MLDELSAKLSSKEKGKAPAVCLKKKITARKKKTPQSWFVYTLKSDNWHED